MAGPYTGAWRSAIISDAEYSGISKWGTGVNPIHGISGPGPELRTIGAKLGYDPVTTPGGDNTDSYTDELIGIGYAPEDNPGQYYGYNVNDPSTWGYGDTTGTADRPRWGEDTPDNLTRQKTQNSTDNGFPPWGGSRKTSPAGRWIRALRRGGSAGIIAAKQLPNEDVAQGWLNKAHGIDADSRPADDSQVFMQTSEVQRYKVRAGSQRAGSQSDFAAPIASRVVGQKLKVYASSESSRHWDMLPYEQVDYVRPFLSRQAGTGYREWNYPNEMYVSPAIQREPAADPALGPVAGGEGGNNNTGEVSYGYSYEDSGGYY